MRRHTPSLIGLAAFAAAALAILFWPLPRPAPPPPSSDGAYRGAEHQTLEVAARTDGSVLRLSSSAEPAAAATSPAPALVGIMGGREAYLRSAASGEVVRVRPGGMIDGWRVAGMDGRTVILVMGGERRRLALFEQAEPVTPKAPTAAPGG